MERITEHPHFFTATNLQWQPLLKPDKYKDIIIESLRFLVNAKRVKVYGFVIFPRLVFSKASPTANISNFRKWKE